MNSPGTNLPQINSQLSPAASLRWFKLPEQVERHPVITQYRFEPVRFKTVHAGRRSFKTEIAKRTLVSEASQSINHRYFFACPTREQAKRIAWNDLKLLADPLIVTKSETELMFRLITGSEIWVIGMDKPARAEGTLWHGGILDEYADMKPEVWPENIRPALMDTGGWCWLTGVPNGRNHFYELSQRAKSGESPEWADYSWVSADVLPASEIAEFKAQYDERTFRQELEGSFESYEGRAYVYYEPETHRKPQSHDLGLPVCVACDFNLDPCIWLLSQIKAQVASFQGEIVQRRTDIWKMCGELKRRLYALAGDDQVRARNRRTVFYGDLEHGNTRSVSATVGSWQIIREEFAGWNVEFKLRPHPRIVDRVNAVNAKLRKATGSVELFIDPKCKFLHEDFERDDMDMTRGPYVGDRTHAAAAAGYEISYEWPITPKAALRTE